MEEAKAYIESGILELYVMGQLNAHEQAEVEVMAAKYPEVKQEIEAIEIAMEQYALQHAVKPSEGLDKTILETIKSSELASTTEPVIVTLDTDIYEGKIRTLRMALVACITLLLASTIALYSVHDKLGDAKNQITSLSLDKQKFANTVNYLKESNADLLKITSMTNDPNWKTVKLTGTAMDPDARMIVYWHVTGKHLMIDNSKMNLPVNDNAHQYQLWALVNGKPVDLGVFDVKPDSTQILVNMKEIAAAQTFAVTLEKRGGSASPTMDQMIVAGQVTL